MFNLMLALHLLTAIFIVGPLAYSATTATRGLRTKDAVATAGAARVTRIYGALSVIVVILGFGLMSMDSPYHKGEKVASFGETWIWLSVVLWLAGAAISLAVLEPSLTRAAAAITEGKPVDSFKARVAASGGIVGLILAVIVFLMVYRPGS